MNKLKLSFLTISSLFLLISCNNSSSQGSINNSTDSKEASNSYYITGDIELENEIMPLTKQDNKYTYSNLKLRRGNSFKIYSSQGALDYSKLSTNVGFKEGNNGYIKVYNEGIYDLNVENNILSLEKKDSSYTKVSLIIDNKDPIAFTKGNDFAFTLDNINLSYRENFKISLDDELLTYNNIDYNDIYFQALRFKNNKVEVIRKGDFNFKLDFRNDNPLLITSENIKLPQELPTDTDSYVKLVNSFSDNFTNNGIQLDFNETITTYENNEPTVKKVAYHEYSSLNEHYYEEIEGEGEDAQISKKANVLTETNYYEISDYVNVASSKPSLTGYLLNDEPVQEDTEDADSTIVKVAKNYITTENARKKINNMYSKDTSIRSYLLNTTKVNHLTSSEHNKTYDDSYYNSMILKTSYNGDIGDDMHIISENTEKYFNNASSKAIKNYIDFVVDDNGNITSGSIKVEEYNGDIFDENNELKIVNPIKTTSYEFTYTYGDKEETKTYHLDPNIYAMKDVYVTNEIDVVAGKTINNSSLPIVDIDPITAIDKSKLQIMEYDSKFFSQGVGDKTVFTALKKGETTIKIGTPYTNFEKEIKVYISYDTPSSISVSPSISSSTNFYVDTTYDFVANVATSYADPAVTVTSLDPSIIEVSKIDDIETQRKNGKANFSLTMKQVSDTPVTIRIQSKDKATVKYDLKISKIQKQLTLEDIKGTYNCYRNSIHYTLNIDENGNSSLKNEETLMHNFKVKLNGADIVLDSSDTIQTLKFTRGMYNDKIDLKTISINTLVAKDGTDVKKSIYQYDSPKFYELWSGFDQYASMSDTSKGATLTLLNKDISDSYSPYYGVYQIQYNGNIFKFNWEVNSFNKEGNINNVYYNNSSVSVYAKISNLTDTSLTISLSKSSGTPTFDETFNFVIQQ